MDTDEVSVEGGNEESGFNFDAVIPGTESAPAQQGSAPAGGNPAWDEALANIPKEFQAQLKPHFEKWDRSTQERFEKVRQEAAAPYQGFQPLIEQQASPQEVLAAYQIWQQLNSDPMSMYDRLGALLRETGQLPPEVQAALEYEEEEGQLSEDPRIAAMQEQLEGLIGYLSENQQQSAIYEQAQVLDNQIRGEVEMIEQHAGPMSDAIKTELYNRASMMTDREQRPVSLIEAYQEMQQVRQMMLSGRPGPQAPRVVPNGGGFPQAQAAPQSFGTLDDRIARMGEIIAQQNS